MPELPDKDITEKIIACAFKVHGILGAGFLEKVYESAMHIELSSRGIAVERQAPVAVHYERKRVGDYYADLLVEGRIVCELKAVTALTAEHETQPVNYLTTTGLETGLLINFGPSVVVKRKFRRHRKQNGSPLEELFPENPEKSC